MKINEVAFVRLGFERASADRFDRWSLRCPEIFCSPVLGFLRQIRDAKLDNFGNAPIIDLPPESDAIVALLTLLSGSREIEAPLFDAALDRLARKMKKKGWLLRAPEQIVDMVYEIQIQLLLQKQIGKRMSFPDSDLNLPDAIFTLQIEEGNSTVLTAIECKNRRIHKESEEDLVRNICKDLVSATSQHKERADAYSDLIIFIDLPLSVRTFDNEYFYRIMTNVWKQIDLERIGYLENDREDSKIERRIPLSQKQVIFTATSQSNMHLVMLSGQEIPAESFVFCPLVTREEWTPIARAFFLNSLFRGKDQGINLNNWYERAVLITNSDQYLFRHI